MGDISMSCLDAYTNFGTSGTNLTAKTAALDMICSDTCREGLDPYFDCLTAGSTGFVDFLCLQPNNVDQYCYVTFQDYTFNCVSICVLCDSCRSCLDDFVDDIMLLHSWVAKPFL